MKYKLKNSFVRLYNFFFREHCFLDYDGTVLNYGDGGRKCRGNGEIKKSGKIIECRCDECDYFLVCYEERAFE